MTFYARHVMSRASIILNDVGAVRWTAPELRNYLNDALRALADVPASRLDPDVFTRQEPAPSTPASDSEPS